MKKIIASLISVGAMVLMAVGVQAATYSAGAVSASEGTATVPVVVTAGSTAETVNGYVMTFTYDTTKVTPQVAGTDVTGADCYATAGTDFADGVLVSDIVSTDATNNKATLAVAWASATPVSVSAATAETMANVKFATVEGATGSADIEVAVVGLTNDGTNVATEGTYTVNSGKIDISGALLGDVNGDNSINGTDLTLLTQYVNEVLTNIDTEYPGATDRGNVNGDESVNGTDLTLLTQYINEVISEF